MTDEERARRTMLLCIFFLRNAVYYRGSRTGKAADLLHSGYPAVAYWRQVNANFFDMAVVEWCKLFSGKLVMDMPRGSRHSWQAVVRDKAGFCASLLATLGLTEAEFSALVDDFKFHRDRFVAHLDDDWVMVPPKFDHAIQAAKALYGWIMDERGGPDVMGLTPASTIDDVLALEERLATAISEYCRNM